MLSRDSAIAYVNSQFHGSFDSVFDCELIEDCGMIIAIVMVISKGDMCRAYIWHDVESNQLCGEL